jgi:hypothetical protein
MIDSEVYLFDLVYKELDDKFENIFVSGESLPIPESLPAVSVVQISNNTYMKSRDYNLENHVDTIYESNVYSNLTNGKKKQCKDIFQVVDSVFISKGFRRIMYNVFPNLLDDSIYRMTGRWRGIHNSKWVYDK